MLLAGILFAPSSNRAERRSQAVGGKHLRSKAIRPPHKFKGPLPSGSPTRDAANDLSRYGWSISVLFHSVLWVKRSFSAAPVPKDAPLLKGLVARGQNSEKSSPQKKDIVPKVSGKKRMHFALLFS